MCCQSFVSSMARATNQRCLQRCRLDCYSYHSITTVRVSYIHIPAEYTLNRSDILPVPRLTSTALSPPPAPARPSLTKISSTLNSQHSIKTFRSSHARFPCTSHSHTKQCNTHTLRLQHVFQKRQSVQGERDAHTEMLYLTGSCLHIYPLFDGLPVPQRTARRTRTWRRTS